MAKPLTRTELADLADSVRRLLDAVRVGELEVSTAMKHRLQGALAGLEAALGRGDPLSDLMERRNPPNPTDDMPSVIHLSCDYGAVIPLFPQQAFLEAMLPEALRLRMEAWQRDFEQNSDYRIGWRSEAARNRWHREGTRLFPEVQEVFRGQAEVLFNRLHE